MRNRQGPEVDALPPGLLEWLQADEAPRIRQAELARVRRRLTHVSLDDAALLHGIATKLLLASAL